MPELNNIEPLRPCVTALADRMITLPVGAPPPEIKRTVPPVVSDDGPAKPMMLPPAAADATPILSMISPDAAAAPARLTNEMLPAEPPALLPVLITKLPDVNAPETAPEATNREPVADALEEPVMTDTLPPVVVEPPVPDANVMEPVVPDEVVPELNNNEPLTPVDSAFADTIQM